MFAARAINARRIYLRTIECNSLSRLSVTFCQLCMKILELLRKEKTRSSSVSSYVKVSFYVLEEDHKMLLTALFESCELILLILTKEDTLL